MKFTDFRHLLTEEGVVPTHVDNISNTQLVEKVENANVVRLVSGEFHAGVYNNSAIVKTLRNRWYDDSSKVEPERQTACLCGGPKVFLLDNESCFDLKGYKNDLVHLIKIQLSNNIQDVTKKYFYSLNREEIHYWTIDNEFIFFQEPHQNGARLEERKSFFCRAPKAAQALFDDFEQRKEKGLIRPINTVDELAWFDYWLLSRKSDADDNSDHGFFIKRDRNHAKARMKLIINNIPPTTNDVPNDLGTNYKYYLSRAYPCLHDNQ